MADSTLDAIRTKVRRLTRSPSVAQISDAQINEYINVAYEQDLPAHLRLKSLRKTFTFFTQPNIDTYATIDSTIFPSSTDPMVDFKNKNLDLESPIYVAGYEQFLSQDRDQFYGLYPRITNTELIGTGDGGTVLFTGTLSNVPVLPGQVTFTSVDNSNMSIVMVDVPVVDGTTGVPFSQGNLYEPGSEPTSPPTAVLVSNNIDYTTGVFTVTFPFAPDSNEDVNAQTVPSTVGRPTAVLYYDNTFTLRPVPDKPYRVEMDMYIKPTELSSDTDVPQLKQMWQYIAYLAAKKVFEDRMDMESVQSIMPELQNQKNLVLSRTIVQQTKQRTATIFTSQLEGSGWNRWGNNF